jgi:hypothetical protein
MDEKKTYTDVSTVGRSWSGRLKRDGDSAETIYINVVDEEKDHHFCAVDCKEEFEELYGKFEIGFYYTVAR